MGTYDRLCRFLSSYPDAEATKDFKLKEIESFEEKLKQGRLNNN